MADVKAVLLHAKQAWRGDRSWWAVVLTTPRAVYSWEKASVPILEEIGWVVGPD